MKTQAIIFDGVDHLRLGDVTLPACGETQLAAETLFTFVSPGTELRVLGGHYGAADRYPVVPGYAAVSRVTALGAKVEGFRVGDFISCRNSVPFTDCGAMWGGQAGAHIYDTTNEDTPILLPVAADMLPYAVVEVAAISFRGVEAADPKPGESAIVIGQGLIGQFSALFLRLAGCRVTVADIEPRRLEPALRRRDDVVDLRDADAESRLRRIGNGGYDIVVEASGSTPGVLLAHKLVRRKPQNYSTAYKVEPIRFYHGDWPRLVMQANYLQPVATNPFDFFAGEGVVILTPSDRGVEERQKVAALIRAGRIDVSDFLSNVCKPGAMPQEYRKLQKREIFSLIGDWR